MKRIIALVFFVAAFCSFNGFAAPHSVFASSSVISLRHNKVKGDFKSKQDTKIDFRYKKKKVRGTKRTAFLLDGDCLLLNVINKEAEDTHFFSFYFRSIDSYCSKRGPPAV